MKKISFFIFLLVTTTASSHGAPLTDAGLTLLEPAGARSAALGEAFSSTINDASAFLYNPSSLGTLQSSHGTFLFKRGVADDSFGRAVFGFKMRRASLGVSAGYFDAGEFEIVEGLSSRTVRAQRDLTFTTGLGFTDLQGTSWGVGTKYFFSELAEKESASAVAVDVGVSRAFTNTLRLAVSFQNFGTALKYQAAREDLPALARIGGSWSPLSLKRVRLNTEGIYEVNRSQLYPAVGIETTIGLLALRSGYSGRPQLEEISLGTGINFQGSSLDYAFGFADRLNSQHRMSFSYRFGSSIPSTKILATSQK